GGAPRAGKPAPAPEPRTAPAELESAEPTKVL
ncbi:D-methionine transport system permease protein, partial [Streptomyces sp. MnatMP-M27]